MQLKKRHNTVRGEDQMRNRYNAMSKTDALTGKLFSGHRQDTAAALEIQSDDCILDLACGPGVNFANILHYLGKNGSLTGLDYSPKMIEQAELLIQNSKWTNAAAIEGDAAKLPFVDGKFDHIIATYAISPDFSHHGRCRRPRVTRWQPRSRSGA